MGWKNIQKTINIDGKTLLFDDSLNKSIQRWCCNNMGKAKAMVIQTGNSVTQLFVEEVNPHERNFLERIHKPPVEDLNLENY